MIFNGENMGSDIVGQEDYKKLLGLYCSYYGYLKNMQQFHRVLHGKTYSHTTVPEAPEATNTLHAAIRRMELFGQGIFDEDFENIRKEALRMPYEEQMLMAVNTGMYEEFMKALRKK